MMDVAVGSTIGANANSAMAQLYANRQSAMDRTEEVPRFQQTRPERVEQPTEAADTGRSQMDTNLGRNIDVRV